MHAWLFYRVVRSGSAPACKDTIARANDRRLTLSKVTGHPSLTLPRVHPLWKKKKERKKEKKGTVMIVRDIKLFFVSTPAIRKNWQELRAATQNHTKKLCNRNTFTRITVGWARIPHTSDNNGCPCKGGECRRTNSPPPCPVNERPLKTKD